MDTNLIKALGAGLVRHAATGLGGILYADGYIKSTDMPQFVGSVMFVAGVAWSVYEKYATNNKPAAK